MASAADLQQQAVELARAGDFGARALEVNLELTRVAPRNEGAWTRLARCYLELGQLDEATAALDTALDANPQNTIARSLHGEVTRRRTAAAAPIARPRTRAPRSARAAPGATASGFGAAEFLALAQLAPVVAAEALAARVDALLVPLNDRPFAVRAVETRNRAGRAGTWLFRRDTLHAGSAGHVYVFHHGGRWEPQLHVGFFASRPWGRDAVCAGIAFDFSREGGDAEHEAGASRALDYFARFQRLAAGEWRRLLTDWMTLNAGFVQYGDRPPATDLLPIDAIASLVSLQQPAETGRVFCGRWLFGDRSDDAVRIRDARALTGWIEDSFIALLPLWASLFRST